MSTPTDCKACARRASKVFGGPRPYHSRENAKATRLMGTPTREPCLRCDMPRASKEDWDKIPGEPNADLCWATGKADCRNPAVDWRARCLKAESAIALLQTPLSPEALQAITEESAE